MTSVDQKVSSPRQKALSEPNVVKRFFMLLGPGLITGASDDDPSGIGTYSIAGATFGYSTLWLALVTLPLMAAVQFSCAKIAMVTGRGLSGVLRKHYPRPLLYGAVFFLFIANTLNVGADLGAIAAAVQLLLPVPFWPVLVGVFVVILALQIMGSYALIANVFKWLTLVLFAYIATAFMVHADMAQVIHSTLIPHITPSKDFISTLVAILGTTISPYLFFWQTNQEIEEEKHEGKSTLEERQGASKEEVKVAAIDVNTGMLLSNLVMYFIIFTCAATLHAHGQTHIESATDAAKALEPLAGKFAKDLLAFGLIGTGMLAIPILTGSSAYALSEAFGWRYGLNKKPHQARHFYGVITLGLVLGLLMNMFKINPIQALFWSAVLNGLVAPPLLVLIFLISNNEKIMGEHVNGPATKLLVGIATLSMSVAAVGLFMTWGH